MRIRMQIFTHTWACSSISSQNVLLLSRVCVRQLSDVTSNTPTHTLFTDYISLSNLRCLQPINIHLSGTSLSLSLVPHDRPSQVSVHPSVADLILLLSYTRWSLQKDQFVKEIKGGRVGFYTGVLLEILDLNTCRNVCPALMCLTSNNNLLLLKTTHGKVLLFFKI